MANPAIAATMVGVGAAQLALSGIAKAIKALYGMTSEINDYLDKHIEEMKGSENSTISPTGKVVEMAKVGFGIGYMTPVVIIAVGQWLLGNTFAAISTVASAVSSASRLLAATTSLHGFREARRAWTTRRAERLSGKSRAGEPEALAAGCLTA